MVCDHMWNDIQNVSLFTNNKSCRRFGLTGGPFTSLGGTGDYIFARIAIDRYCEILNERLYSNPLKASANYADGIIQLGIANSRSGVESTGPIKLQVSHLLGAFGLMFLGHGVGLGIFIGELIIGRRKQTEVG